jgi:hypothetical protein
MRVVQRPEIKGGNVSCVSCKKSTRSHRLENPEYEEYEEVWEEEKEEYQARKKTTDEDLTEEEVVIRYRLLTEQVCMCHGCWLEKRNKAISFLEDNKDTWIREGVSHLFRITRFIKSWDYYGFDTDLEENHQEDLKNVRRALKNSTGISEEE